MLYSLKGKRILGVNPPVQDFAFFDLWAKPMGLLYLLGRLRDLGNIVSLIDCVHEAGGKQKPFGIRAPRRFEIPKPAPYAHIPRRYWHFGLGREELVSRLKEMPLPDLVLVTSSMTYWYPALFWTIAIIRATFPSVPVFLGGPYPVLCPDHARKSGADSLQTETMPLPAAIPAMDLYGRITYGITMTSTGCPGSCSYCASGLLWPHHSKRKFRDVFAEVSFQTGLGATDIAFYDDALLEGKGSHFIPLCASLKTMFPCLRFHTPNGLNVREIDVQCAKTMYRCGFSTIRLSLEGTDPLNISASRGKTTPEQYAGAVENLRSAGFTPGQIETYVLVGLPGQKFEEVAKTIEYVHSLGARAKIAQLSPIPGTDLFGEIEKRNPCVAEEPLLQNNSIFCQYISKTFSPEELQRIKDLANSSCSG
jgi:hypothetical protein